MWMFGQTRWSWSRKRRAMLEVTAAAAVMVGGNASAASGWSVASVPQTGKATVLYGAFARTPADMWIVGQQYGPSGVAAPLPVAYHWDGGAWSLVTTAAMTAVASLRAVSAFSTSDAWAVGYRVSGSSRVALAEHWNGAAWSIVSFPRSSAKYFALRAVADLGPSNAYAVGSDAGVAYHWDGAAWSTLTLPDPGFAPSSIAAVSPTDIWLVGSGSSATTAQAMHFDGSSWTVVPMQQPGGTNPPRLNAVTAVAANDIWAVGEVQSLAGPYGLSTLIEHWNGSAWSIVPSPTPTNTLPSLTAVADRGPGDVYAVGWDQRPDGNVVAEGLILRWDGSRWSQDADPTGDALSPLYAAATVPGAAQEWAAGFSLDSTGTDQPLVLSHN
jgi:hypothetical protein